MFAVQAKIYGEPCNQSSFIAFDETSSQKAPNFSAFCWSPHDNLVSIGQLFVTTRVVHLPKRTETSLNAELDRNGPNLITESGSALRAVHGCNKFVSMDTFSYHTVFTLFVVTEKPRSTYYTLTYIGGGCNVRLRVRVCDHIRALVITVSCMVEFENDLSQMIIMI